MYKLCPSRQVCFEMQISKQAGSFLYFGNFERLLYVLNLNANKYKIF